jgi:hypothetical protein
MGTILPQTLLVSFPIPVRFCTLGLTNCQTMEANGAQCLSNAVPVNVKYYFTFPITRRKSWRCNAISSESGRLL